jgi:hypothetical protein
MEANMVTATVISREKASDGPANHDSRQCIRCGGLLVREICIDLSNSGEWEVESRRCVQCGEVVDPVILANRTAAVLGRLTAFTSSAIHRQALPDHNLRRTS